MVDRKKIKRSPDGKSAFYGKRWMPSETADMYLDLKEIAEEMARTAEQTTQVVEVIRPRGPTVLGRIGAAILFPFRMVWHMIRATILFGLLMAVAGVPATAAQMYWGDPTISVWTLVLSMLFLGGLVLGLAKNAYTEMR